MGCVWLCGVGVVSACACGVVVRVVWCVVKLGTLSLLFSLLPLPPANSVLHVPLPLSATTAATSSSSAIVGKCEQGGKQSINQKCF